MSLKDVFDILTEKTNLPDDIIKYMIFDYMYHYVITNNKSICEKINGMGSIMEVTEINYKYKLNGKLYL